MYYEPKYFKPEEIFPPSVIASHKNGKSIIGNNIWRLIDERVLFTLDALRKKFGVVIVNDYIFGGKNKYRGYRPCTEIIDWESYKETGKVKSTFSSFTSQHCFGRAIDCKFKEYQPEQIRRIIRTTPNDEAFKFISAIENDVSWFHFDVRPWDKSSGILFFSK